MIYTIFLLQSYQMLRHITSFLLITILFTACKKETTPAPVCLPPPVVNKLIVWCSNTIVNTKSVYVTITNSDLSKTWQGVIFSRYASNPGCNASNCFTIELSPGTYYMGAETYDHSTQWGTPTPISFTIVSSQECKDFQLY